MIFNSIYVILPLISGISALWLGFVVLIKNKNSKVNQALFRSIICIVIWLSATACMFMSEKESWEIFWDRIAYIGVVFIPITVYHFGLEFTKSKRTKTLSIGYFLSLCFLILSQTDYFIDGLYSYSWGVHSQARIFHHIFLVYFFLYISLFFFNIYRYRQKAVRMKKNQANYILLAFFVLSLSSSAFLPAYGIDFPPFSYLFAVICVLILTLAITRYHLFETRVILTELLVGFMGIVLLITPFLMDTMLLKVLMTIVFLLFCIFGYYLIKAIHEEVRRKEDAENLLKIRTEFLSIASHQLRTPLTAIRGYLSMLEEGDFGNFPKESEDALVSIKKATMRMIKLSNNLLSVSRLETGRKIDLVIEEFDFNEMFDDIFQELKILAKEKGLYLEWNNELSEKLIVRGDASKIKQIVGNIIENCIHYTSQGGITVETKKNFNKLIIKVSDTGVGMEKSDLAKLFKVFSRGRAGNQFYSQGSGLGMYIVKKFVTMHRGRILAASQGKDKGSTFYIELPIIL